MIVHYLLALAYSEFSEVLSVKRFPVVEVTLKVIGSDTVQKITCDFLLDMAISCIISKIQPRVCGKL